MTNYDDTYLIVKHLPKELSDEEKVDFLRYFGASVVKCLPNKYNKGNACFARFSSKEQAKEVISKLHQVEFLDQLLSVEFVRGSDSKLNPTFFAQGEDKNEDEVDQSKYLEQFLSRLNSWTNCVDLQRPPPSHLRYCYPAPDVVSLTNIVRAIYSVPKLYTQVLHLMNRMNLPCPFDSHFPIDCQLFVTDSPTIDSLSEDESEMEEESHARKDSIVIPPSSRKRKIPIKRPRLIKTLKPSIDPNKTVVPPSEIFEARKEIAPKRIEVKVSSDLSSIKDAKDETLQIEHFEPLDLPENKLAEEDIKDIDETYKGKVITEEELKSNRISSKDQRVLPVFKNYQAGIPSCRLYIKNLAKNVVVDHLHYVYRRYFTEKEEEQGVMYDIRLMQEGRMKGQAFVTLQGIEEAKRALQETNGFVLQGKPMVVQFARSAKQKPDAKAQID